MPLEEALCLPRGLISLPCDDSCHAVVQGKALRDAALAVRSPSPQNSKQLSSVLCKLLRLRYSDLKHSETWSQLEGV